MEQAPAGAVSMTPMLTALNRVNSFMILVSKKHVARRIARAPTGPSVESVL
jgi:hypothetical protein